MFLTVERDRNKRRVKPVEQACVLDFDEESSDDSDFRIEDHPEVSDDDNSLDSHCEENGMYNFFYLFIGTQKSICIR